MLALHSSKLLASSSKPPQETEPGPSAKTVVEVKARNKPQDVHEQLEKLQIELCQLQQTLEHESRQRQRFERKVEQLEQFCISRGYVPALDEPTTESNSGETVDDEDERQLVLHRPPTPHSPSQDGPCTSVVVRKESPQCSEHTAQGPRAPTSRSGEGSKATFAGVKTQGDRFEFGKNQSAPFSFGQGLKQGLKQEGLKRRYHEMSPPVEGYAFTLDDLPQTHRVNRMIPHSIFVAMYKLMFLERKVEFFCEKNRTSRHLHELLSSNSAPKSAEQAVCAQIVADGTAYDVQLGQSISEIERKLQHLAELRNETQVIVANYRKIIHPIRRLPPEVLAEIFSFHVEVDSSDPPSSLNPRHGPWVLSQICSLWRRTCLYIPKLWSHIHIQVVADTDTDIRKAASLHLGLQLERTASHPLSVSLYSKSHFTSDHFILPLLLPSSHRWHDLSLRIRAESYIALGQIEGFLQSLQHLQIRGPDMADHLTQFDGIISLFRFSPKLRSVEASTKTVLRFQLPWTQILQFSNPLFTRSRASRTKNNLELLNRLLSLERCLLACRGDVGPQVSLVLPRLRDLDIRGKESKTGIDLTLRQLTLPSLNRLHLHGIFDPKCIVSFLSRSACNSLKEIGLHSPTASHSGCLLIIKAMPTVERLVLSCKQLIISSFLNELINDASVAPLLSSLVLSADASDLDPLLLVELAETRPTVRIHTSAWNDSES